MTRAWSLSLLAMTLASALHAQMPPGQMPPGQMPPGQMPPGQMPSGPYPSNPNFLPYPYMPYPEQFPPPPRSAAQPPRLPPDIAPLQYEQMPPYRVAPASANLPPNAGAAVLPATAPPSQPMVSVVGGTPPAPASAVPPAGQPLEAREAVPAPPVASAAPPATDDSMRWWDQASKGSTSCFNTGFGIYYLKPHFDTNPAFARSISVPTIASATTTTTQQNFDWDYTTAPLVWVEWAHCCGLGVRGRFWMFDGSPDSPVVSNPFLTNGTTSQVTSAFPLGLGLISNPAAVGTGFNDTLLFSSGLKMQVYDLEVTKRFWPGPAAIAVSGGLRYARVSQSYNAFLISTPAVAGADSVQSALWSNHDFHGVGGTLALEVAYPIGSTGLSVFANGRGSLLYGRGNESANLATVTTDPSSFVTTQALTASTSQDRLMPVAEIEIGVEYGCRVGRGYWFVQTALVDQVWFGAGNAANNDQITGSGTVLSVPATQTADNHTNLGLFGLRANLGFRY